MIQCSGYTKKRIIRHSLRLCNSNSEVAEWDNKGSSDRRINNKKCRKNLEEVNNAHKGRPCGG